MPEIQPITPEEAEGEVQEIYQRLQKKSGKVFNIYQMMGNSPAVLGA